MVVLLSSDGYIETSRGRISGGGGRGEESAAEQVVDSKDHVGSTRRL